MNLKQFKYILVLSEVKNFSKAADILNVSQPSLSQYVKYLEKELNVELFDRSGNDLKLTDSGKAFIEAGKKILDIQHQLYNEFSDISNGKQGSIIVGASLYRGTCIMPEVISKFKEKYPGIRVIVEEKREKDLLSDAEDGAFDIFLTTTPINEKKFAYKSIVEEEFTVCAPSSLDLKADDNNYIDVNLINNLDFIALDDNQLIQSQFNDFCEKQGIKANVTAECRNIITQLAMVNEGVGCAIVPSTTQKFSFNNNNIKFYKFKQKWQKRNVVVAYLKNHYLSEATKYLIELLTNMFGKRD